MKKYISVLMAIVLCAAMSVSASAATIDTVEEGTNCDNASLKGSYVSTPVPDAVYSVDIIWGSMEFTYTTAGEGEWNPASHQFENATDAGWSCEENENKITVTNHSNAKIEAEFTYRNNAGYSLSTAFNDNTSQEITKLVLPTAEAFDEVLAGARTADAFLVITGGTIADTTADNSVAGTVTVTISDPNVA